MSSPDTLWVAPQVVMDDITTIIDDTAVLHRLRLELPAGRITVLMGPSGGGKTTLIKHLVGLLEPDGGAVLVDGRDLWDGTAQQWQEYRHNLGAMLGGSNLFTSSTFGSLSVLENLIYSLESLGVPKELRRDRALARLAELDLLEAQDLKPEALPAHTKKRLALARALVLDAPLTVLDEIDLGMDMLHSGAMLDAVRGLHHRVGATVLVTTHNLDVARSLADYLAILVHGRIVAFGPPDELLDGVGSTDDFDRRFEFSDYLGPAQLQEAEAAAVRERPTPAGQSRPRVDPRMVWIALIALAVIVVVFVMSRVALF